MCEKLMNNPELFRKHFLSIMVELAEDKVVNVKLVLAEGKAVRGQAAAGTEGQTKVRFQ